MRSRFVAAFFLASVLLTGCESLGEKLRGMNWDFKAEKEQLAPHEEHRELLEDLARPR